MWPTLFTIGQGGSWRRELLYYIYTLFTTGAGGILASRATLLYIYIYTWVQSEGGGPGGVQSFLVPPPQKVTGSLLRNCNYIFGILSSNPVDWHPFRANWVGGGLWTCPKVRGTCARVQAAG